jgi:hypothetical protein
LADDVAAGVVNVCVDGPVSTFDDSISNPYV